MARAAGSRCAPFVLGITFLAVGRLSSEGATLPAGFNEAVVASGLTSPTAIEFAPDGRLFIAEQPGHLRVVKNGMLLPTPFVTLTVSALGERGLLGVAFDPGFATNGYVYVYYTATTPTIHNRISRFTANGDVAAPGSELVILDLETLGATNHNGGAIHFGDDGKLYVAVGDNAVGANAQSFTTRLGKMLRINPDGSIPTDNPFYTTATELNRAIWALGLRNPFTFSFQPLSGRMFINDVGESTWEEINEGVAGANYGWPITEGPTSDPRFNAPLYAYNHSNGCAISGGAFYNPPVTQFPPAYVSSYFFADYCGGWIRQRDPSSGNVTGFATGILSPVDLKVGAEGGLYYLARTLGGSTGAVYRIDYGASAPNITGGPNDQTAAIGEPATFSVTASGTPTLFYQWQRNGVDIPGATAAAYTLPSAQASDDGALFRVRVTNSYGSATSQAATLTVLNTAPVGFITQPVAGTQYTGGSLVNYAGTADDAEEGELPASAFTWWVDFHHDTHIHPFLPPATGSSSGSFVVPATGETSANVWYRIYLQVADSRGLTHTSFRDITPRTVQLTLATLPAGLQVTLDGQPHATPFSVTAVAGMKRTIGAVTPQPWMGTTRGFLLWSDLGANTHEITVPGANATYTAVFQRVVCGLNVNALVDVIDLGTFPVASTALNLQVLLLRNHTLIPIGGPLTLTIGNLQNASLLSQDRTLCGPSGNDPAVIVHAGDDRLAAGESTLVGLWFLKTQAGSIVYTPSVLSAPLP